MALAGFSALAAALAQKPGTLTALDRFRTINLLVTALTPAFVSTFPLIGEAFGAAEILLWRGTSIILSLVLALLAVALVRLAGALSQTDRAALSGVMWVLFLGGYGFFLGVNLLNASGMIWLPGPGPILASLVWLLLLAAVQLVRIVAAKPTEPAA